MGYYAKNGRVTFFASSAEAEKLGFTAQAPTPLDAKGVIPRCPHCGRMDQQRWVGRTAVGSFAIVSWNCDNELCPAGGWSIPCSLHCAGYEYSLRGHERNKT